MSKHKGRLGGHAWFYAQGQRCTHNYLKYGTITDIHVVGRAAAEFMRGADDAMRAHMLRVNRRGESPKQR